MFIKKPNKKIIWLVNFALPLRGCSSHTFSMLRAASLHEAQNFLDYMTLKIHNSKFKIQNELKLRVVSNYSQFFYREFKELREFKEFKDFP